MSLRTTIRAGAIATALLAGLVSLPGQALASTAPPTARPLPVVQTPTGLELAVNATAGGASQVTAVSATIDAVSSPNQVVSTVQNFSLTSGTSASGTWQSSGSLGLSSYGNYLVRFTATDADGQQAPSGTLELVYKPFPVHHDVTYNPTTLTMADQTLTVTGRLTTYDPAVGDTGTSWSAPTTVSLWGPSAGESTAVGSDGSFSLSARPGATAAATFQVMAESDQGIYESAASPPIYSTRTPFEIQLDSGSVTGAVVGSQHTVAGTASILLGGTLQPAAGVTLTVTPPSGSRTTVVTDAHDRFSFPVTVPAGNAE